MLSDDTELLLRFAEQGSEAAFAELVRRHIDRVYAVALRRVAGDALLAQDVAQGVFTDLARKAPSLTRHPALGAWLFRSARFAASQAMRAERRRRNRELEAHRMQELTNRSTTEPNWNELRPLLDDVMDELPERDRAAVWLRFYEGRTFAEASARLAASEDAVRVRVERALEKMRASLARHGVASTTAALSTALAHEGGVVAPAGFAASVTGMVLAGAAATGGGIAAGLGLSTFMSITKLGVWGVAAVVLCASLGGNAYLLTQSTRADELPPARVRPASAPPAAATPLAHAKSADLAALRDELRAAGASEASIRAMLEGILRRCYREKLSADRAARARAGWWRDPRRNMTAPDAPMQFTDDPRLLREMVTLPLEKLLGPDPVVVAEADARYAFLPPELRRTFGQLDRDVPPSFIPTGQIEADGTIEAENARQRRAIEEKRKALVDSLTPEQRADWEMRLSPFAINLGRQLERLDPTEAEYRAVFPIADACAKTRNARLAEASDGMAVRDQAEQQAMADLVATLGFDRALDYIWGDTLEYAPYARVAREANLPASTAGRVMQLAAETASRAAAVHAAATLSVEQKRAALVALQQSVQPELDALMPAAVQQRVAPNAQAWFTGLADGSYKPIRGSLPGSSGKLITFAQSVADPLRIPPHRVQPLPRPPAGK